MSANDNLPPGVTPFPPIKMLSGAESADLMAMIMAESAIVSVELDQWYRDQGDLLLVEALRAADGDYNNAAIILVQALKLLDESELRQKALRMLGAPRGYTPDPKPEAA